MKIPTNFTDRFHVAEHLKAELGYNSYEFLRTDVPFPTDEDSYIRFVKTMRFIDKAIAEYESKRSE
ncbi:hypothetical protein [Lactiplantibacillus mudanjiangensis]|uniref:Uncharacterized protein n=1 Tax=Lactiplantibacillus mudanjiangensis TaxID=1296538 RepID=A0A660E0H4_9LACO|nr:hypothetical protein [Lactiplantibacillus mudanjiangensis]VDG25737.1 hypothetical protein [Lactobacillus plantarum] [Lactiplantibacillus mudanjiangensis]VDG27912.1 hypothetical protein [Lactobacillus plantarum] [Lactiplantibacillus mudanjiangensis]